MLYHLLFEGLVDTFSPFNIFRYISFRVISATTGALIISLVLGPSVIARLKQLRIGEYLIEDGPSSKEWDNKAGTPTMGGILIIVSILVSVVFWGRLDQSFLYLMILTTLWFGGLGSLMIIVNSLNSQSLGLRGWHKIGLQTLGALAIAGYLYQWGPVATGDVATRTSLTLPFFKTVQPELGFLFIPFATLVIVGTSNAVNLTDGMDGLAIGCTIFVAGTLGALGYMASHHQIANYLNILHFPVAGEVTAEFLFCLVGAGLGFLWYNSHPAQVFMGDTGSPCPRRDAWNCSTPHKAGISASYRWRDFRCRGAIGYHTSLVLPNLWQTRL